MNAWLLIRRLRGPAFLILVGITALAERAAIAAAPPAVPPLYPGPYAGSGSVSGADPLADPNRRA
jgi:hypothetical protein